MVLADFTILIESDIPRDVRVVVYDHVKCLRIAAARHENRTKSRRSKRRGLFSDTLGICHRFTNFDRDGKLKPQCAIVRLAWPNLGVGIISHEMTHAAVWIRELDEGEVLLTCKNDELLAWIVGELVRQAINGMNDRGVFEAVKEIADV